jgi:RNA polymerase sigma factor (sigma-70 family)
MNGINTLSAWCGSLQKRYDGSSCRVRKRSWSSAVDVELFDRFLGVIAMPRAIDPSTNLKLLKRLAALKNQSAWRKFFAVYDPLVERWCSSYRFDPETLDELCQRIRIELLRRMPEYSYDPSGSFRGWLRRLCHHRALDLYNERRDQAFSSLTEDDLVDYRPGAVEIIDGDDADEEPSPARLRLFEECRLVHEEVKRKVKPERWEVFWRVVIEGESIREAANSLGLKYTTAYAGANHVAKLLREEGQRRKSRLQSDHSSKSEEHK